MENQDIQDNNSVEDQNAEEISARDQKISEQKESDNDNSVIEDLNNKYLRLYAEFENYKKRTNKDKDELVKYGNESLLYELLPAIDNLELALKHASGNSDAGLVQGVEMTLKELHRTLEKFGLSRIEATGKPFDPAVHHAMMNVERKDMEEKFVAEELRAGYIYRQKVLRPSLVAVSIKPQSNVEDQTVSDVSMQQEDNSSEKNTDENETIEIKINKDIEEDS